MAICACGGSSLTEPPTNVDAGQLADASSNVSVDSGGAPADAGNTGNAGDAQSDSAASGDSAAVDAAPTCLPGSCVVTFASGPEWLSYSGTVAASGASFTLTQLLGPALDVCLNAGDPTNCPSGAFLYGYATSTPALTGGQTFPDALWIWRPDVAPSSPASMQVAIFEKTFVVGPNATGSLQIAVDDFAAVFVNGIAIGAVGSTSDVNTAAAAHTAPTTLTLTPALQSGSNTVVVAAQNGPFGCSSSTCPYSEDPAAVVFEGTLRW